MNKREQWGSRRGFVLATIGAAVGLGNIWRFSYVAGENGGAVFLLREADLAGSRFGRVWLWLLRILVPFTILGILLQSASTL